MCGPGKRCYREQGHSDRAPIVEALAFSYELGDGIPACVGASAGIAMSPEHATEVLPAVADAALYEAKSNGRSCCRVASADTNLVALRWLKDACTPVADTAGVAA